MKQSTIVYRSNSNPYVSPVKNRTRNTQFFQHTVTEHPSGKRTETSSVLYAAEIESKHEDWGKLSQTPERRRWNTTTLLALVLGVRVRVTTVIVRF